MAKTLLSELLIRKIHIALIILLSISMQIHAQNRHDSADLAVVSVDSKAPSIDVLALSELREGSVYFIRFGNPETLFSPAEPDELVELKLNKEIASGRVLNIALDTTGDQEYSLSDKINYEGHNFFIQIYEDNDNRTLPVSTVIWGENKNYTSHDKFSELNSESMVLSLAGGHSMYYYIGNGVSGTVSMLQNMVSDPANWRISENVSDSGVKITEFNILDGPVINFTNNFKSHSEEDSMAYISVSVFDHDGSRLFVDLVYDSLLSTTNSNDLVTNDTVHINFNGIIGDATFDIPLKVKDDLFYEGNETAIYRILNPSKGNLGDFITHSLIIADDELADIRITSVYNSPQPAENFITLSNFETKPVNLKNWKIEGNKNTLIFQRDFWLQPLEVRQIPLEVTQRKEWTNIIKVVEGKPLVSSQGGRILIADHNEKEVFNLRYKDFNTGNSQVVSKNTFQTDIPADRQASMNDTNNQNEIYSEGEIKSVSEGWKIIHKNQTSFLNTFDKDEIYYWSESEGTFKKIGTTNLLNEVDMVFITYIDEGEIEAFADWKYNTEKNENTSETGRIHGLYNYSDKNNDGVITGIEKVHLIKNSFTSNITAREFKENLARENGLDPQINNFEVYVLRELNRNLRIKSLKDSESISAGEWFWLISDTDNDNLIIDLQQENWLTPSTYVNEQHEKGILELVVEQSGNEDAIQIEFSNDGINWNYDLASYDELKISTVQHHFSIIQSKDYFETMTYPMSLENKLQLNLEWVSSLSTPSKLMVSKFINIPADWYILLKDHFTDKEYTLKEGFSIQLNNNLDLENPNRDAETGLLKLPSNTRFTITVETPETRLKDEKDQRPQGIELHQNFPNPFNPATMISFYLPEASEVKLSVYNIVGQPVAELVRSTLSEGSHQYEWNASDFPSGMYIYQLETQNKILTRKMTLVK